MSTIFAIVLWGLSATGSYDACEAVAASASMSATTCAAPPPPSAESNDDKDRKVTRRARRISNGF